MPLVLKIWLTGECCWEECECKDLTSIEWMKNQINNCRYITQFVPTRNNTWVRIFKEHKMIFVGDEEAGLNLSKANICLHECGMRVFGNVLVVNDSSSDYSPLTKTQRKELVKLVGFWMSEEERNKAIQETQNDILKQEGKKKEKQKIKVL